MTDDTDDTPEPLQRPPAAPTQWATVTRLGPRPERPGHRPPAVAGSLALATGTAPESPANPPQRLRLVGEPSPASGDDGHDEEVRAWAARFAQAVVEVLGGDRPLQQLLRWTSHRVYLELERRLTILSRTSDAGRRRRTVRPQVRSVHVCRPAPAAAEVSVHVRHGQRSRAIAARLEHADGRWRCTALQLG